VRFLRIEIEEFGKLKDMLFLPGEGLNLFEGANESGKSTILAFLRFVLYGFPRKGTGEGEEREKRLSWRTQRAAGSVVISTEAGEFCIKRQVTRQGSAARESFSETLCVTAQDTGEAVPLGDVSPGEYFLGLPAMLYDSTMCLRQSDAERVSDPDVSDAVGELLFVGNGGVGADAALDKLRLARRELQHVRGRGGRIAELEDRVAAGEDTLARAKEDAQALSELRAKIAKYREHVGERRRELEEISARFEEAADRQLLSLFEQANVASRVREQKKLHYEALYRSYTERYANVERELAAAEEALRAHRAAELELLRLTPELQRMRGMKHDENMLEADAIVRERGGSAAVLSDFQKAVHARGKRRKAAWILSAITLFFATVTALIATGTLLPLLQLFLPTGDWVPGVCMIGFAVSALFLIFTLLVAFSAHRYAKRVRGWLKRLHVGNVHMFRTYLEQCAAEAETAAAHREVLGELEGSYAAKEKEKAEAEARLCACLHDCGISLPESVAQIPALLDTFEKERRAREEALSAAHLEYERTTAAWEALARPLAGKNEADLRARTRVIDGNVQTEDEETLRRKQGFLRESLTELETKLAAFEREESALCATAKDPAAEEAALQAARTALAQSKGRLEALELAISAMDGAARSLRDGLAPRLCRAATAHFATLTEGAYQTLHAGKDLSVLLDSDRGPLPLSHFSAGCRDAAHLSLRLGLLEILSEKTLPLLLDEAFSRLDDQRARALLGLLMRYCESGGQVLLFTCHSREATFLADEVFTHFELQ